MRPIALKLFVYLKLYLTGCPIFYLGTLGQVHIARFSRSVLSRLSVCGPQVCLVAEVKLLPLPTAHGLCCHSVSGSFLCPHLARFEGIQVGPRSGHRKGSETVTEMYSLQQKIQSHFVLGTILGSEDPTERKKIHLKSFLGGLTFLLSRDRQ